MKCGCALSISEAKITIRFETYVALLPNGELLFDPARKVYLDSAAVESVDATVVEKKQGIYTHMQSEAHVPWFRVVFEMTDGSLMEFQIQQGDFRELEKGDRGMLTYQGNRYICYQKYKFKSEAQEEEKC